MPAKPAFLLFGTSPRAAQALRESFERTVKTAFPSVRYRDVSALSYADIRTLYGRATRAGYAPIVYVKESALPRTITETWMKMNSTYGYLRQAQTHGDMKLLCLSSTREMVTHATTVMEAEAMKPKEPTEADRLRTAQKSQDLMTKKREQDQLLQAKTRDLQKKSREAQQKLTQPKSGAAK